MQTVTGEERFNGEHRDTERDGGGNIICIFIIDPLHSPLCLRALCVRRSPVSRFVSLGKRTFPRRTQRNGGVRRGKISIYLLNPLHSPLCLCGLRGDVACPVLNYIFNSPFLILLIPWASLLTLKLISNPQGLLARRKYVFNCLTCTELISSTDLISRITVSFTSKSSR